MVDILPTTNTLAYYTRLQSTPQSIIFAGKTKTYQNETPNNIPL
jgi:hypothetical protein